MRREHYLVIYYLHFTKIKIHKKNFSVKIFQFGKGLGMNLNYK